MSTSTRLPASYLRGAPKSRLSRYNGWLPARPEIYREFIQRHRQIGKDRRRAAVPHQPIVQKFADTIRGDPEMSALMDEVFIEAAKPPNLDTVDNFDELLYGMDAIVVAPPKYYLAKDENGNIIGEPVGVPMHLLFDLLSNTAAAYDLFRRPAFNQALKEVFDEWGRYLTTSDSNKSLNETEEGWFGAAALASLEEGRGKFNDTWICPNPDAENRGYESWDTFFTRLAQPNARPVLAPEDKSLIHNACESTTFAIATDVKKNDQFWLKTQAYSLRNMLNKDDDYADKFVGGTVYQAFLSPQDYHRWHAPVDGTIVDTVSVPGTYYGVLFDAGAEEDDPDLQPGDPHGAIIRSQAYLTTTAARALIYIQADNPAIGLMCFIGIGMGEVSTCEITVNKGDRVKTGDEIGMFHFGGSSHAMIFGPQAKLTFAQEIEIDKQQLVNSVLAQVEKA
ncbi:phosphatidylserine decarboxylase [Coprinopsis cinerea AmutBmut pab1-1]|nr:phosphatidylserine decarboxylase [Coprinopsis cinerea AmutBmut pab1-1]